MVSWLAVLVDRSDTAFFISSPVLFIRSSRCLIASTAFSDGSVAINLCTTSAARTKVKNTRTPVSNIIPVVNFEVFSASVLIASVSLFVLSASRCSSAINRRFDSTAATMSCELARQISSSSPNLWRSSISFDVALTQTTCVNLAICCSVKTGLSGIVIEMPNYLQRLRYIRVRRTRTTSLTELLIAKRIMMTTG